MHLLYEPRGRDLAELIKTTHGTKFFYAYGWCYYDLVTTLIRKRLHTKQLPPQRAWATLSTARLKRRYGRLGTGCRPWLYALVREDLVQWDIILYHTYQVALTRRRVEYKLKDERWARGFQLSAVAMPRAYQVVAKPGVRYQGEHRQLQTIVRRHLSLDYEAALNFCDQALGSSLPLPDKAIDWQELAGKKSYAGFRHRVVNEEVYSRWLYHVNRITGKDFRFKHCLVTGRDFTTVTAFPSLLRKFLLLDGEPVVESDVRCAQPLLFTKLVHDYCAVQQLETVPADVVHWQRLCEEPRASQSLYPYLFTLMQRAQVTLNCLRTVDSVTQQVQYTTGYTKGFKVEFFAEIFFARDKNSRMRQVFVAAFPTVSAAITHWKNQPGANLAVHLQRLEATLLLEKVCPLLLEQKIKVLTVLDALLSHARHKPTVAATIRQVFRAETGLTPVVV